MQVEIEDLSSVRKKLSFTVDAKTVDGKLGDAYKNLAKQVKLKGFRPGKVPRKVLERRFGRSIAGEVGGQVISDAFDEAIKSHELTPVSQPEVNSGIITAGQDYTFTVTVEVRPSLTVEGWEGLKVEWPVAEPDNDAVDAEIESMRQRESTLEAAGEDHAAEKGDMLLVKLLAQHEDLEDKTIESLMVVADSATGMPAADWLAEHVVGAKPGETRELELEVPPQALDADWDGKTAKCTVTVEEIKISRMPELDDDFAQDVGFDSLDLLRADVMFRQQEQQNQAARQKAAEFALDRLLEQNEFEVPTGLVRSEAETMLAQNLQQFARQGLNMGNVRLGDLPAETQERMMGEAELSVRRALVLTSIADSVDLKVSDDDLDEKIEEIAAEIGQQASAVKGLLRKRGGMEELRGRLREEKALDLLLEKAEVVEVEWPAEEDAAEADADDAADAEDAGDDAASADEAPQADGEAASDDSADETEQA